MARSDLVVALVKASASGDKRAARSATEAIIAEERAKQHHVFADRLNRVLQMNGNGSSDHLTNPDATSRPRDFVVEVTPRRRFEDLVLPEACKRAVEQLVEEQHRADLLRAHGLEPRHTALLIGPPGTGKTSLAEGIAEAVGVSFFIVRYEAIIGSYLGETASRLKRIFDYTKTIPCVLFFDEFDAIGKERGDIHETGEIKRVVTSLLMQIDELPSYTIVLAATNHAELLDRATWRRFQLRLSLPMPDQKTLARYVDKFVRHFNEPLGLSAEAIAQHLGRISFAEAEEFCLDLRRQQVLSMGDRTLKVILAEQLRIWSTRASQSTSLSPQGKRRARASASDSAAS
jgi:SpoVK/Ycf46/Vps4 family AAA+-type ATPase